MASGLDMQKEFDDAYAAFLPDWTTIFTEMKRDLEIFLGDQWDARLKSYLAAERREALVFNKIRRIIKAVAGYQRKNRLAMRIDPVEGSDQMTAELLSGTLMWNVQAMNGYNLISDAFERGSLITGLNMVEVAIDYENDMVNGDIVWLRHDYNSVMFDLNMRQPDMKDSSAILNRVMVTPERLSQLLPTVKSSDLPVLSGTPSKFVSMNQFMKNRRGQNLYTYDRMWVKNVKSTTILIDKMTGQMSPWKGSDSRLREMFELMGVSSENFAVVRRPQTTTELRVFVNDRFISAGPDPTGLDCYPMVPFFGFYVPEAEKAELRIQGLIRCDRDPQDEVNKRRSKMLDIIDTQISSGYMAREKAVRNPSSLYQTGQGKVIWISDDAPQLPLEQLVRENRAADIPQGLFTLTQIMDNDVMEIPGFNNELLGMPDSQDIEISALLAKLRQSSGLTVLSDLFDNLDRSQKILGGKTLQAIQKNYTPSKIQRINNKPPTKEFYDQNFGKYDCVVIEGLLTDTQRQQYYSQLMAMRKMGAEVIPWSAIIEAWPLEGKSMLLEAVQAEEKARAAQAAENQQLNQLQIQLNQAMMQANMAKAAERLTQAQENRTTALFDRVKALKELQSMDVQNLAGLIKVLEMVQQAGGPGPQVGSNPQIGQTRQADPAPAVQFPQTQEGGQYGQ
jgi:hypothetical protein